MGHTAETYCRICEAACGLEVVYDHNGTPSKLQPDKEHPSSKGYVCAKGTRFLEVAQHPARLLSPQARDISGVLRPISWRDAFTQIGAKLRPILDAHGPHALGIYFGNPLAFNALGIATMYAAIKAIGTHNVFTAGSQDCNNKLAAAALMHGSPLLHPIPDLAHAANAFFFGTNPAVSQSSFVHLEGGAKAIDDFVARGGKIHFVDVRQTESARRWGDAIIVKPGTDIYLLLALLHLCDRGQRHPEVTGLDQLRALAREFPIPRAARLTGVPAATIEAIAHILKGPAPSTFHMSVGVNQGPFGSLAYVVLQALALVTHNLDRRGGVLFHPWGPHMARLARLTGMDAPNPPSRIGGFPSVLGTYPGGILADEIKTPGPGQIKALLCVAGDPIRSIPGSHALREAIERLELVVSIDLFENKTGAHADFLLPGTSWLERWDVATTTAFFQSSPLLQWGAPVKAAPGQTKPEAEILYELCKSIDRPLLKHPSLAWLWRQLAQDHHMTRASRWAQRLMRPFASHRGFVAPAPKPNTYLGKGPRTPDKKIRFWAAELDQEVARLRQHAARTTKAAKEPLEPTRTPGSATLQLLCRRRKIGHNSWLHGGKRDGNAEAFAWLSPQDHATITEAEHPLVEIRSQTASLHIQARSHDGVSPGTIVLPHGLPESNVNELIPSGIANIEPVSGQHLMTGITVQVTGLSPKA